MKGYRFYKEYNSPQDKRKDKPTGNVFAALTDAKYTHIRDGALFREGFGAIYFEPNSPCVFASAQVDWLRDRCKRISEAEARQIHPRLFERIEQ